MAQTGHHRQPRLCERWLPTEEPDRKQDIRKLSGGKLVLLKWSVWFITEWFATQLNHGTQTRYSCSLSVEVKCWPASGIRRSFGH